GALRQLTRAGTGSPEIGEAVQDIEEEVQRLNRVVDDVLDFARPIHVDLAPTDINTVAAEAVAAAEAARPAVPIAAGLDAGLPLVPCDGDRLRTVLVNVLGNAQQATSADGASAPDVVVSTGLSDDGRHVRIVVADTGVGV